MFIFYSDNYLVECDLLHEPLEGLALEALAELQLGSYVAWNFPKKNRTFLILKNYFIPASRSL